MTDSQLGELQNMRVLLDSGARGCPLDVVALGLVVYLDLLSADVLLYYLRILDNLLADADLLPDHGPLLDDHLFLDDRHHYLLFFFFFFSDLRACAFPLDYGDALDGYLHALLGHDDALPVGTH